MQVLKAWAWTIAIYLVFWASMGPEFARRFVKFVTQSTVLA